MRIVLGFLALVAVAMVLTAGAVVALAVELLPYIIVGMVIGVLLRRRRRPHPLAPRPVYRQPLPPSQRQLPQPPGGWVYVPVWVGPPPQRPRPVIDAEVIADPRHG
jgi:hypothetical protein